MKSELRKNKYLVMILLILIVLLILTPVLYKNLNSNIDNDESISNVNKNNKTDNDQDDKNSNDNSLNVDNNGDNDNNFKEDSNDNQINKDSGNDTSNGNNDNNSSNNNQSSESFVEVVEYFDETDRMISAYSATSDKQSVVSKLKTSFTTVVDFLFYDKPIKGYTFKELTLATKLKICKIALSIDNKIDLYFPGYKDTIKNGFNSLKAKVIVMYLELTNKACSIVGSDVCTQARLDFKNMKEVLKIDFEFIKGVLGSSKEALSEWYQSFK